MNPAPFAPAAAPRSDLPLETKALVSLWRAFWFDLPILWASEIDRFVLGRVPPVEDGRG